MRSTDGFFNFIRHSGIRTSLRHSSRMHTGGSLCSRPYEALELVIDFEKHLVLLSGSQLHLTPVEYKIVTYLAQHSGKVLTYSAIMQNVWGPYTDSSNKILRSIWQTSAASSKKIRASRSIFLPKPASVTA